MQQTRTTSITGRNIVYEVAGEVKSVTLSVVHSLDVPIHSGNHVHCSYATHTLRYCYTHIDCVAGSWLVARLVLCVATMGYIHAHTNRPSITTPSVYILKAINHRCGRLASVSIVRIEVTDLSPWTACSPQVTWDHTCGRHRFPYRFHHKQALCCHSVRWNVNAFHIRKNTDIAYARKYITVHWPHPGLALCFLFWRLLVPYVNGLSNRKVSPNNHPCSNPSVAVRKHRAMV
jgi:hypothetical protein